MRPTAIIPIIILFLSLCSCRTQTKYVPMEIVRIERTGADTASIYARALAEFQRTRWWERQADSVIDRSKETVVLNDQGDTVKHNNERIIYKSSVREKELEREIQSKDSIIQDLRTRLESVKVDSIPVPYPVERKLTRWEQVKMEAGGWAIGAGSVFLVALVAVIVWLIKMKQKK